MCRFFVASADKSVRFWNVRDGKLIQAVENVVEDPERVHICANDTIAVVNSEKYLLGLRMTSGDPAYKIDNLQDNKMLNFVVCGKDKSILVAFGETTAYLLDAITGKQRAQVTPNSPMGSDHFNAYDPISGNGLWYLIFHAPAPSPTRISLKPSPFPSSQDLPENLWISFRTNRAISATQRIENSM